MRNARWAWITVGLSLLGLLYSYPFIWMLGSAFKDPAEFFSRGANPLPGSLHWSNFAEAWTRANFSRYFGNTLIVALSSVTLILLISSMAGFALARLRLPGKKLLVGAILATLFLPRGYTILPVFNIIQGLGLLNSLAGVILANVGGGLVYATFLFKAYFETLPQELEEAASLDGATIPRIYWSILLPLAGPVAATVGLFAFIAAWNDFFTPLVFTLGKPELRTLAVGMYAFQGENSREWTLICAGAAITIVPILCVFFALQRYFIEGLGGAVKS